MFGLFGKKQRQPTAPLQRAYRVRLLALNDELNHDPDDHAKLADPKIVELLKVDETEWGAAWNSLNEVEFRLVNLMPQPLVSAEITRRTLEFARYAPARATALKAEAAKAKSLDESRAALAGLLNELQNYYSERRANRNHRRYGAERLNLLGAGLLVPLILGLILLVLFGTNDIVARIHILVVIYFGLLGAYLSRMIAFQGAIRTIDYNTIEQDFSNWSLIVRLITGILGALVVYLLIAGDLLSGELFPDQDFSTFWKEGTVPTPTGDLAKLLVWSLIAGFSERLIPDQLTRLGARVNEPPATAS